MSVWFRSLYWRIAAGFVLFLAGTLAVQVGLFLWVVARGEGDVPARSLENFAALVAQDVAVEVGANRAADLDRHLGDRYGSLPRTIWVVFADGRSTSGKWGPPPPGLARAMAGRMRGLPPPAPAPPPGGPQPRRRPAFAPAVVAGQTIAMVVVEAGRPPGMIAKQIGPILAVIAIGLILGAGALAAVLIFRPAHNRLRELTEAARRLGEGDPVARATEQGGDEIAGVVRAFNRMADALSARAAELQESDRARRQLLADVSHELMTPLTAIRGYLETLSMPGLDLAGSSRHRYLEIVSEETLRLERIIGDLLDLSRLEAGGGALTIEPVALDELFGRVLDRHGHAADERGVTLEAGPAPGVIVSADRIRLEQVLQNLAANALRHTPKGGRVSLSAGQRDGGVVIRVEDTGEGIAPEHLPYVFDRFYKGDASRTDSGGAGSGLGLSIVKAIVERHGGRITATSTPGVGTTLDIFLPASS